jgi:SpoVK/Ycf46/Vps4 family AAA+-type ATPase
MEDLAFDFLGDGLADAGPTEAGCQTALHPWLSLLVLRALDAQLDLGLIDADALGRLRSLLSRHTQKPRKMLADADPDLLADFVRQGLAEKQREITAADAQHRLQQLAAELAEALGLERTEAALTAVALACVECQDIPRAMDLGDSMKEAAIMEVSARVAGIPVADAIEALGRPSPLRAGAEKPFGRHKPEPSDHFNVPWRVAHLVKSGSHDVERIVRLFFQSAPPAELTLAHFRDQPRVLQVVREMVSGLMLRPRKGVNILIHGAPGTGKTQFVRALSEAVGGRLLEVGVVDADGDPINPRARIGSLQACLSALERVNNGLVVLDEAEDIFPCDVRDFFGSRRSDRHKGWLSGVLESNPRPVFWLCNRIDQIDPAYLRRFDIVTEMRGPGRAARAQMVDEVFENAALPDSLRAQLAGDASLSPAHLRKIADVLGDLHVSDSEAVHSAVACLVAERRKADGSAPANQAERAIRYRPECTHADTDLTALAEALGKLPEARVCLYGPPGTGKTEWALHLAQTHGMDVLVRRGSDLLGPYVGQTEARVAAAFREAEDRGALLLVDEADSFLGRRERTRSGWEVGMVNEFLQALERFRGLCVVTTNFMDGLDPASARRFDFKIRFEWLRADQVEGLFCELLDGLGIKGEPPAGVLQQVRSAGCLAPGDFANVARQNRLVKLHSTPQAIAEALLREVRFKDRGASGRRFGYI